MMRRDAIANPLRKTCKLRAGAQTAIRRSARQIFLAATLYPSFVSTTRSETMSSESLSERSFVNDFSTFKPSCLIKAVAEILGAVSHLWKILGETIMPPRFGLVENETHPATVEWWLDTRRASRLRNLGSD